MSKDVFVFVESKEGTVRKVSLELLSKGKEIAGHLASRLHAVVIGYQLNDMAESLKAYSDSVIVVDNKLFKEYSWDIYTAVFAELIKKYNPYMVLGPSTVTGKDFFPRLAARLRGSMVSDAIDIDLIDGKVKIKKPLFGGKVFSWVECRSGSIIFVTFRPNSFSIEAGDLHGAIVEEHIEAARAASTLLEKALAVAAILVPICVTIIAGRFADASAHRSTDVQMVQLAVGILQAPPKEPNIDLRRWAIDIIDAHSSVPLPDKVRAALADSLVFPHVTFSSEGGHSTPSGFFIPEKVGTFPVVACVGDHCDTSSITIAPPAKKRK